jgi:tRNA pseudouridine38-40 synthase
MVLNKTGSESGKSSKLNIKLIIEYDGKNYAGWQKQKNKSQKTIQETIEHSLQVLFTKEKIKLIGAGRTDAGVHALNQAANFKIRKSVFPGGKISSLNRLTHSLNSILPADIAVKSVKVVNDKFHARFSAKKRVYKYLLTTAKRAYNADKYFRLKTKFDIDLAKEYCKFIEGEHSFKQMCKNREDKHGFMSNIFYARIKKRKDYVIEFEICANRFLHSMVRAIVGMIIEVASGKISLKEFITKFEKGEPLKIQYVPSNALILDKIIY